MKTVHSFTLGFILILMFSCNHNEVDYYFMERQSESIHVYRHEGFYEYSSRLNDSMWKALQSFDKEILTNDIFEAIENLDIKIKQEKPSLGCYIISWKHNNIIMMEWNPDFGVIIRVFTKSEHIKKLLPAQSY